MASGTLKLPSSAFPLRFIFFVVVDDVALNVVDFFF